MCIRRHAHHSHNLLLLLRTQLVFFGWQWSVRLCIASRVSQCVRRLAACALALSCARRYIARGLVRSCIRRHIAFTPFCGRASGNNDLCREYMLHGSPCYQCRPLILCILHTLLMPDRHVHAAACTPCSLHAFVVTYSTCHRRVAVVFPFMHCIWAFALHPATSGSRNSKTYFDVFRLFRRCN